MTGKPERKRGELVVVYGFDKDALLIPSAVQGPNYDIEWVSSERPRLPLVEKVAVDVKQLLALANFSLTPHGLLAKSASYVGHLTGSAGAHTTTVRSASAGRISQMPPGWAPVAPTNKARGEA
jgi:hypothetical protein